MKEVEIKTVKLEPCPFCGSEKQEPSAEHMLDSRHYVWCPDCGAIGPDRETKTEGIKIWNKRFSTTEKAYNQINRSMRKLGYPVSTGWGTEGHVQIDVYSVPAKQKDAVQSKVFDLTHKYFIDTEYTGTDIHVQVYTKKETKSMGGPPQTAMNLKKGKV